jgi:predicted ribosome quality control (RQC) complex YloA/Tae2 family protein
LDSQKLHQKAAQIENEAIKKVDNVRKDHEKRVKALNEAQETKQRRAELIEMNRELVDKCLTVIR